MGSGRARWYIGPCAEDSPPFPRSKGTPVHAPLGRGAPIVARRLRTGRTAASRSHRARTELENPFVLGLWTPRTTSCAKSSIRRRSSSRCYGTCMVLALAFSCWNGREESETNAERLPHLEGVLRSGTPLGSAMRHEPAAAPSHSYLPCRTQPAAKNRFILRCACVLASRSRGDLPPLALPHDRAGDGLPRAYK
jgi:hypothetical protein